MQQINMIPKSGEQCGSENRFGTTNYTVDSRLEGYFNNLSSQQNEMYDKFNNLLNIYDQKLESRLQKDEFLRLKPFPRYMNQKEVIAYLGHEKIFKILVEEFDLKPVRQEHKCCIYCSRQVEEQCIRFENSL